MKQGEIYRVNLDPVVGYEVGGEHLVAVMSNNLICNSFLPVVVVPLLDASGSPTRQVYGVLVTTSETGLSLDVVADCLQVRVLDQSRFTGAPEGNLSHAAMKAVEQALHRVFKV